VEKAQSAEIERLDGLADFYGNGSVLSQGHQAEPLASARVSVGLRWPTLHPLASARVSVGLRWPTRKCRLKSIASPAWPPSMRNCEQSSSMI
jgi:hypothetical protein